MGKSTTIKIIVGLISPEKGDVLIAGHSIVQEKKVASSYIGLLQEDVPLYSNMRVCDYLQFVQDIHSIEKKAAIKVSSVVERCGLTAVNKRLIGNLSKGYRQRVGLAQSLVYNAPIIILDEANGRTRPLGHYRDQRVNLSFKGGTHHFSGQSRTP